MNFKLPGIFTVSQLDKPILAFFSGCNSMWLHQLITFTFIHKDTVTINTLNTEMKEWLKSRVKCRNSLILWKKTISIYLFIYFTSLLLIHINS